MSNLKLKPCPMCGCRAEFDYGAPMNSGKRIVKVKCSIGCIEQNIFRCEEKDAAIAWNSRTQPEATAPAQDLSAAILALPCKMPDYRDYAMGSSERGPHRDGYRAGHRAALKAAAALASSSNALSAGDSEKALDALLTRIDDAFEAYERYGAICEFEGNSMIYADTLIEIVTLRGEYHAILQSQKGAE